MSDAGAVNDAEIVSGFKNLRDVLELVWNRIAEVETSLRADIAALEHRTLRRFDSVDARFESLETRFDRLEVMIAELKPRRRPKGS
jgi:hypothetical protein